jgi:hypothetical protein
LRGAIVKVALETDPVAFDECEHSPPRDLKLAEQAGVLEQHEHHRGQPLHPGHVHVEQRVVDNRGDRTLVGDKHRRRRIGAAPGQLDRRAGGIDEAGVARCRERKRQCRIAQRVA